MTYCAVMYQNRSYLEKKQQRFRFFTTDLQITVTTNDLSMIV